MVAPGYTLVIDQKRLGPFEKPLRMTVYLYIINITNSLKYKRRRIRRQRIAPEKNKKR